MYYDRETVFVASQVRCLIAAQYYKTIERLRHTSAHQSHLEHAPFLQSDSGYSHNNRAAASSDRSPVAAALSAEIHK